MLSERLTDLFHEKSVCCSHTPADGSSSTANFEMQLHIRIVDRQDQYKMVRRNFGLPDDCVLLQPISLVPISDLIHPAQPQAVAFSSPTIPELSQNDISKDDLLSLVSHSGSKYESLTESSQLRRAWALIAILVYAPRVLISNAKSGAGIAIICDV